MDAEHIYTEAAALNLTGAGYAWIVTEQALKPKNTPIGVIGLLQEDSHNEADHIQDSVEIIGQAFSELHQNENISEAPHDCKQGSDFFTSGHTIFK